MIILVIAGLSARFRYGGDTAPPALGTQGRANHHQALRGYGRSGAGHYDDKLPGFGLYVGASGSRSYFLEYRPVRGRGVAKRRSRIVHAYLLGQHQEMNDLMAWNADGTRLPYRMHSEYLRQLFLGNDLAQGRDDGRPSGDHQRHSRSCLCRGDRERSRGTLDLGLQDPPSDRHRRDLRAHLGRPHAGIVSEPGHPGRSYQIAVKREGDIYVDPETWRAATPSREGSWWPELTDSLGRHSSGQVPPPGLGAPDAGYPVMEDAPGRYVLRP